MENKIYKKEDKGLNLSYSLKDAFINWLFVKNQTEHKFIDLVNCIDAVSDYAIKNKISLVDFWDITNQSEFRTVHQKIINDILFRVVRRRLYKIYQIASQLFIDFLGENANKNSKYVLNEENIYVNTSFVKEEMVSPKIINNSYLPETITKILVNYFSNGFKMDSPIELVRFRQFLKKDYEYESRLHDNELLDLILSNGKTFDGKVYIIADDTIDVIRSIIDTEIKNGVECIFYSTFFERNEEWLYSKSIISAEMLKELLIRLYPKYFHKLNYYSPSNRAETELTKISKEIRRAWGEEIKLTYKQIEILLPYIPIDKIKYVLCQDSYFIWESTGTYTNVEKIEINEREYKEIEEYVASSYQRRGYSSFNDIPMDTVLEKHSEISLAAIHSGIYIKILSELYDRKGKIITRKGDKLDVFTIIKEFCKERDKCTLQELLNYEKDLTGEIHRWSPMEAGYEIMIRVSKNDFISEKYIDFSINEIDNAIEQFIAGNYLPLKGVTTFATFPHCNYPWNLFLLESYCRRFSEEFYFNSLSVNSRNVGVIIRKNYDLDYHQIMLDAVHKSGIQHERKTILEYLFNNGYIGKRSYSKIEELIKDVMAI